VLREECTIGEKFILKGENIVIREDRSSENKVEKIALWEAL
jgi:hypothetical protein